MDLKKADLKDKIDELESQIDKLINLKKHTYIHETHHLYCDSGEMHFGYGAPRS